MRRSNQGRVAATVVRQREERTRRIAMIVFLSISTSLLPMVIQGQEAVYDDLDLREAHVLDVAFTKTGDSYRFDVTLIHDDDGEAGYADWWQVERLDGTRLGRRTLLHAHGTRPFTRSETVSIPASVDAVVVRGHDQTHGYGGTAMIVDLRTGRTESVDQGAEADDFTTRSLR